MGDIVDFKQSLKERVSEKAQEEELESTLVPCPKCEDVLYYAVYSEEIEELIIVCQHCGEPLALGVMVEEDDS